MKGALVLRRRQISVIMPAYNEGRALGAVLERVHERLLGLDATYQSELILIDDGSGDETAAVLAAFARRFPQTRVLTHDCNRGLVEALKTGIGAAGGEAVVVLDADLSYAPDIVEPLVRTLFERRADVVIASPYMRGGHVGNVPLDRLVASRCANWLLSALVGGRIKTFTGMVRAYDGATIRALAGREIAGEFNAGVLAAILRERGSIVEIPAALVWPRSRTDAPSRMTPATLWRRFQLIIQTAQVLSMSIRGAR